MASFESMETETAVQKLPSDNDSDSTYLKWNSLDPQIRTYSYGYEIVITKEEVISILKECDYHHEGNETRIEFTKKMPTVLDCNIDVENCVFLTCLVVPKVFRRRGLGSFLMYYIATICFENNIDYLVADDTDSEFFKTLGFISFELKNVRRDRVKEKYVICGTNFLAKRLSKKFRFCNPEQVKPQGDIEFYDFNIFYPRFIPSATHFVLLKDLSRHFKIVEDEDDSESLYAMYKCYNIPSLYQSAADTKRLTAAILSMNDLKCMKAYNFKGLQSGMCGTLHGYFCDKNGDKIELCVCSDGGYHRGFDSEMICCGDNSKKLHQHFINTCEDIRRKCINENKTFEEFLERILTMQKYARDVVRLGYLRCLLLDKFRKGTRIFQGEATDTNKVFRN